MKHLPQILVIVILCGCGPEKLKENEAFVLADNFSTERCETTPECDCCSADLILLSNERFVLVDRCLGGDTYFAGQFAISESQLRLTFQRKIVNEIQDDDYNVTGYSAHEIDVSPEVFTIKNCGNKVHLLNVKDSSSWRNGSRYEPKRERDLITGVTNEKAWEHLIQH